MQDHTSPATLENAIALQKYGVGQPVRRKEDDTLVRGKGKYTDDFSLPGQAYCWMVRSSHAHGIIKGIDTSAARAMPGVLGVWTGADLAAASYNPFTCGIPLKSRDGSPLLDRRGRGAILFDIGGGSTELVRIERDSARPDAAPRIKAWMSIPFGVVSLAEQFGGRDVTEGLYARMVAEVAQYVAPFAADHGTDLRDMHMLGTSGTVTTLAGVFLNLPRYDRRRIDGIWMNDADVTATIQKLLGMSYHERINNSCISIERADLVLAGCAILDAVRNAFPLPRLRVADRGLREGMLVEMMREDGALRAC